MTGRTDPEPEATESTEATESLLSSPEPGFAARVLPPAPERPRPTARRVVFLDVENTSRPQHLAHVIEHLAVDHHGGQTELVAVANWKVVSHESARLLAKMGAHLVHSAPSTGVRDWSDLRIAVAAGIWLAAARPGDAIEIVSDDRAFDAVGDVAASLGIEFHRVSYRRLVKEDITEIEATEPRPQPRGEAASRRRYRGRRRPGHGPRSTEASPQESAAGAGSPRLAAPRSVERGASRPRGPSAHAAPPPHPGEPHTAPHDEVVSVVQELVAGSRSRSVIIDAVEAALKARGFQRPPGSPRLVTRLRRIREIVVSSTGTITLADGTPDARREGLHAEADGPPPPAEPAVSESSGGPGGSEPEAAVGVPRGRRRRRRRGRGGRRPSVQNAPTA